MFAGSKNAQGGFGGALLFKEAAGRKAKECARDQTNWQMQGDMIMIKFYPKQDCSSGRSNPKPGYALNDEKDMQNDQLQVTSYKLQLHPGHKVVFAQLADVVGSKEFWRREEEGEGHLTSASKVTFLVLNAVLLCLLLGRSDNQ
ncbi:hypothetical protein BELL_1146g00010 [Botrytis elliptica]|uniref:Uncharacterized protein n=1 Tax=Botrytis elliptica TaxID=278938 RepID=A0A4Z1IYS6_9HELO|nr:hypothetical protein EAE99_000812 [Botrytis elliptica]TGO61747.1 hypothetical protein BELL_1146g00010 [Botrytis elliptica]